MDTARLKSFTVDKDLDGMEIDSSRSILEAILIEGSEDEVFDRWAELLYTAALLHPKGRSRGEAMAAAMDILSEAKGSAVYTLGAVPMEAAFNRGEFCRVGAESSPFWENYSGRGIHYRERSSTLNGLRSLTGRRHLSGRFFSSDPGTFFLGDRRRAMEPHRRCTRMRMQAILAGLLTNTDSISALTPPAGTAASLTLPQSGPADRRHLRIPAHRHHPLSGGIAQTDFPSNEAAALRNFHFNRFRSPKGVHLYDKKVVYT